MKPQAQGSSYIIVCKITVFKLKNIRNISIHIKICSAFVRDCELHIDIKFNHFGE